MDRETSFAHLIKQHRKALDLTQAELARRVGCATITLRKIEAETLRPSVQIAERLAMALNVPLEERADFVRFARTAMLETPEPPATPTPPPLPEEIGTEDLSGRAVRGYDLGERIGSGGFGAVYRAVQPGVEREVAVKIILPQYANHPDFIRRFEAEAQLVARLEHPHIVPLYDYWREPNAAYLVMRLLRGGSLNDLLKNGPLPLPLTLQFLEQISQALHAAHRFGVIHRDLKPANILLDEDQNAYLADFGVAKNLGSPDLQNVTNADAIVGSPAYMSPEQIRADPIRPQADIYCLGIVLYEMLTGHLPFKGPTPIEQIMRHLSDPLPPLNNYNVELPYALDPIIQKATAKDPALRYPDVLSMLEELRPVLSSQLSVVSFQSAVIDEKSPTLTTEPWKLITEDNPYKGLHPFGEADADNFFGRETFIQELLGRLCEEDELARFLAVVGPSGSGKSSVVKAGLIPAIRRGALPGSENWFVVDFMPGSHPLEELEAALLRIAVNPPASMLTQLKEDTRGLLRAVKRILPPDESVELIMVIDQFEEVFTLVTDETARAHFLESLVVAILDERSRLHIVITLRADFTDRPLQYVDFGDLLRQRTEFILPLAPDELELAITAPAKNSGLILEDGLTARIVRELGDQPGVLPLLQYALTELFEHRDGHQLTLVAYQKIGGVLGALGRRSEEIYTKLDEHAQAAARQLFLRLVTLGEGVEDTRRRVLRSELISLAGDAHPSSFILHPLEVFGKARLLTFDHDPVTRSPTVEVAHEALLREWNRLREWLNKSRADVRLQSILAQAALEWTNAARDPGLLLRGTRLTQLDTWAKETTLALTSNERNFLDASLEGRKERQVAEAKRREREWALEQRSQNFLRGLVGVLTGATIIAMFLTIFAFNQRNIAQNSANASLTQQAIAQEETNKARVGELAALSLLQLDKKLDLALLLSAEAYKINDIRQTQNALYEAWLHNQAQFLQGQPGEVRSIAWSANGQLASSSIDWTTINSTISVWDLKTNLPSYIIKNPPGIILSVAWSPDGQLASSLDNGKIIIWDMERGQPEKVLQRETYTDTVTSIAWSLTGQLASGYDDGTIILWDLASNQPLQTLQAYTNTIDSIAWSLDGRLASGSNWGPVVVWDLKTGQPTKKLLRNIVGANTIAWSPNGQIALGTIQGDVIVWDPESGTPAQTLEGHLNYDTVQSVAWSVDGRLVSGSQDKTVIIWDLENNEPMQIFRGHSNVVTGVSWSPDGRLASSSADSTIILWDTSSGPNKIEENSQVTRTLYESQFPGDVSLAWSTDNQLAIGSMDGLINIWDLESGETTQTLQAPHVVDCVAWSLDGRLASGLGDGRVIIWDLVSGKPVQTLSGHKTFTTSVAWSPDGRLASGSGDGTVIVWDLASGQPSQTYEGHDYFLADVAWSADGRLAFDTNDDEVVIWSLGENNQLDQILRVNQTFPGISHVAWSADGRLASGYYNGMVVIWDLVSGQPAQTLQGYSLSVRDIAWSLDGRLASASFDGPIIIWDLASSQPAQIVQVQTGLGNLSFAWSETGQLAIGVSGRVILSETRPVIWLTQVCQRAGRNLTESEWNQYLLWKGPYDPNYKTCPQWP